MIKEVTVKEVKKMLDNNEAFQFIDVREKAEVEVANIGAMNIPMGEVMDNLDKVSKEKMTVVHCRSGARSAAICNALYNAGYSNVYNMKGGIKAWAEEIDPSISLN